LSLLSPSVVGMTSVGVGTSTALSPTRSEAPSLPTASLSPSRAADFMSCPLRYRFRAIDRLPERSSPQAVRGTVVHAVLERLFDLPAAERTLEQASNLVGPEWHRLLAAAPELADVAGDPAGPPCGVKPPQAGQLPEWLTSARKLLSGYFELEDPQRLEPAEREHLVSVVLDSGLTLRGYIDRLDATPSGEFRVVDYKTGRTPGEAFEGKALFQLKFYALVLWRTRGRIPAELRLLYLNDSTMLRYTPDEGELRAFERLLDALWRAVARATATGDFRARRGVLCQWCDHQQRCPEWGGTPPPLPPVQVPLAASGLAYATAPRGTRQSVALAAAPHTMADGTPTVT